MKSKIKMAEAEQMALRHELRCMIKNTLAACILLTKAAEKATDTLRDMRTALTKFDQLSSEESDDS